MSQLSVSVKELNLFDEMDVCKSIPSENTSDIVCRASASAKEMDLSNITNNHEGSWYTHGKEPWLREINRVPVNTSNETPSVAKQSVDRCSEGNLDKLEEFHCIAAIEKLLEDDSDSPCADNLGCCNVLETELPAKCSGDVNSKKINDLDSLSAAFGENMRNIWTGTSECQPEVDDMYHSGDSNREVWNYKVLLGMLPRQSQFPRSRNSSSISSISSISSASSSEDSGISDVATLEDFVDLLNEFLESEGFVNARAEDPELETQVQCLKEVVADIVSITKDAEEGQNAAAYNYQQDYICENIIKYCESLDFSSEGSSPERDLMEDFFRDSCFDPIFPDKDFPNDSSQGARLQTHFSTFQSNRKPAEQFCPGFSSAYRSLDHHPVQKVSDTGAPLFTALNVPCSHWCDLDFQSHVSACRLHLGTSDEPSSKLKEKASESRRPENCSAGEKDDVGESRHPVWLQEEPSTYSRMPPTHVSSEPVLSEKLYKTFFWRSRRSENVASSSPVEEFFNSLYLPEDILHPEIPEAITEMRKRNRRPDSGFSSLCSDPPSPSPKKSTPMNLATLMFQSDDDDSDEHADETPNTDDVWGDKDKEIYWIPLSVPPATDTSKGQRTSSFDSRVDRKNKYLSQAKNRYGRFLPSSQSFPAITRKR